MSKMFFCYEFDFADRPVPVVYGTAGVLKTPDGKDTRRRVQLTEVDGSLTIDQLVAKYPYKG